MISLTRLECKLKYTFFYSKYVHSIMETEFKYFVTRKNALFITFARFNYLASQTICFFDKNYYFATEKSALKAARNYFFFIWGF